MCKCCKAAKVATIYFSLSLHLSPSFSTLPGRSAFLSLLALSTKLTVKIKTITHFYCCSSHESQIESEHRTKSFHSVLFSKAKSKRVIETARQGKCEKGRELRGEKCVYNCISVKLFNLLFVRVRLMMTTLNVFLAHKLCFLLARI